MNYLLAPLLSGVAAFIATNIDDLVILTVFFAQSERFRWQQIVAGQYLGFTALVLVSIPGFFGGLVISKPIIGLLGLVPIAIGVSQWLKRQPAASEVQAVRESASAISTVQLEPSKQRSWTQLLKEVITHILHPQTYSVATVTFANGGDNVGTYIPLFASSNLTNLLAILGTFLVMVGLWCYLAYGLAHHPVVSRTLTQYGDAVVPLILIGLGIYILVDNGTLAWLF